MGSVVRCFGGGLGIIFAAAVVRRMMKLAVVRISFRIRLFLEVAWRLLSKGSSLLAFLVSFCLSS